MVSYTFLPVAESLIFPNDRVNLSGFCSFNINLSSLFVFFVLSAMLIIAINTKIKTINIINPKIPDIASIILFLINIP